MRTPQLSLQQTDRIIYLAWQDRITFEEIKKETGLSEAEVIKVMRKSLKPSSFRLWRKRVSGRTTKHQKLNWQRRNSGHAEDLE
ncbi:MAG: TIGR03643 family protein [Deltaproteobacteria bacterium]